MHQTRMKKIRPLLVLLCLLFFCTACAKETEETQLSFGSDSAATDAITDANADTDTYADPDPAADPAATTQPDAFVGQAGAHVTVLKTVAHTFEGMLYGAVEYRNTGSVDIIITQADFHFTVNGGAQMESFEPILNQYDVVSPGESGYCTLFLPAETLEAGGTASLTAELTCARAARTPAPLLTRNPYLVQNYPNFATLSGSLGNPPEALNDCELNMVYAAFYDANDALLGVWYFSRNAVLAPGVSKHFVIHLRALPIPALAENTKSIRMRAFGVD